VNISKLLNYFLYICVIYKNTIMKNLLIFLLISTSVISCGTLEPQDIHSRCQYFTETETVNDTVYIKTNHIHVIYDCEPRRRPINNDWIIMY